MRTTPMTSRPIRTVRNNLLTVAGVIAAMALTLSLAQEDGTALTLGDSADHGLFIADGAGMALYVFLPDEQGASTCTGDCAANWPPVLVATADTVPALAEGLDASLVGTVGRDDGTIQLTYNDWPLYHFAADAAAGETNGQGVGESWYLIDAAGEPIGVVTPG